MLSSGWRIYWALLVVVSNDSIVLLVYFRGDRFCWEIISLLVFLFTLFSLSGGQILTFCLPGIPITWYSCFEFHIRWYQFYFLHWLLSNQDWVPYYPIILIILSQHIVILLIDSLVDHLSEKWLYLVLSGHNTLLQSLLTQFKCSWADRCFFQHWLLLLVSFKDVEHEDIRQTCISHR